MRKKPPHRRPKYETEMRRRIHAKLLKARLAMRRYDEFYLAQPVVDVDFRAPIPRELTIPPGVTVRIGGVKVMAPDGITVRTTIIELQGSPILGP